MKQPRAQVQQSSNRSCDHYPKGRPDFAAPFQQTIDRHNVGNLKDAKTGEKNESGGKSSLIGDKHEPRNTKISKVKQPAEEQTGNDAAFGHKQIAISS